MAAAATVNAPAGASLGAPPALGTEKSPAAAPSIYSDAEPPEEYITTHTSGPKEADASGKPSYEFSIVSAVLANVAAPFYLYTEMKGKSDLWDRLLADVSDGLLRQPTLDVCCGRGLSLLKVAERKKVLATKDPTSAVDKAYGIDIFKKDKPSVTAENAAALGVTPYTALHASDCTKTFPFRDGSFALVTSSLSLHYVSSDGRKNAVREMVRMVRPGGQLIVVTLTGYIGGLRDELRAAGWPEDDVDVSLAGPGVMYGMWPGQVLRAKRPKN